MSEEEKSLRDQINEKLDQIGALTEELKEYKAELKTIQAKVAHYGTLCRNDPNNVENSRKLDKYEDEKIGMDRKISATTENLTELVRLINNNKLEKLLEGNVDNF